MATLRELNEVLDACGLPMAIDKEVGRVMLEEWFLEQPDQDDLEHIVELCLELYTEA